MARLIVADSLFAALHNAGGCDAKDDWSKGYDAGIDAAIALLEKEPTIEFDPVVHGYWIPVSGAIEDDEEWVCSSCEHFMVFQNVMSYEDMRENFPRCPKCGAYMDAEEE